jgi:hypothetical protein
MLGRRTCSSHEQVARLLQLLVYFTMAWNICKALGGVFPTEKSQADNKFKYILYDLARLQNYVSHENLHDVTRVGEKGLSGLRTTITHYAILHYSPHCYTFRSSFSI